MNTPGSAEGNWCWRCTDKLLSDMAWGSLLELTKQTGREATRLDAPQGGSANVTSQDAPSGTPSDVSIHA